MISSLSVIIPAYNEEKVIAATLRDVSAYLKKQSYDSEIILINDGSTDNTAHIANDFCDVLVVNNANNKGKGEAVKQGVVNSTKEFLLFIDADHAVDIKNCDTFISYCDDFNVVIGSKYIDQESDYPAHRKVIGKTFSKLKQLITGLKTKDTQCGFKLYKTAVAQQLFKKSIIKGWCFDVEILLLAQKEKIKILELPVDVKNTERVSRINVLSSGTQMFIDLIKLRINFIRGKYQ